MIVEKSKRANIKYKKRSLVQRAHLWQSCRQSSFTKRKTLNRLSFFLKTFTLPADFFNFIMGPITTEVKKLSVNDENKVI